MSTDVVIAKQQDGLRTIVRMGPNSIEGLSKGMGEVKIDQSTVSGP